MNRKETNQVFNKLPKTKEFKGKIEWNLVEKGWAGMKVKRKGLIDVRHHKNKDGKILAEVYFSKKFGKVFGEYIGVKLFFSDKYLGVQLTNHLSEHVFTISSGTKRKHKIVSKALLKVKPRYWEEEDILYDLENKMLMVPITLITKEEAERLIVEEIQSRLEGTHNRENKN